MPQTSSMSWNFVSFLSMTLFFFLIFCLSSFNSFNFFSSKKSSVHLFNFRFHI